MLLNILIGVCLVILLILLSMLWPPESPWSPWWKIDVRRSRLACKRGKVGKTDVVYELGSGNATFLAVAAKEFGARGVGVELDPPRTYLSRILLLLKGLHGKVVVQRRSFFDVDLSPATVVYVYLIPKTLVKLEEKFRKELKPGTRIISYHYPIEYLPQIAEDKKERIMVYEMPKTATGSGKK